jgi:hypothetical protein
MRGNHTVAEATVRAGCRYYFGYPITPQNETPEYMAERLSKVEGGVFIQAESEIAAIPVVMGARMAGARVMTASFPLGVLKDVGDKKEADQNGFFSGFGGQGIVMMGYLLATAGRVEDKSVTCLPSYSAEVRGGSANCTVVISTEEIALPVASEPEYAVLMNNPSLIRFQNQVQSGGTIFLNSSMIEAGPIRGDLEIYEVPASDLAKQLGQDRVTNMCDARGPYHEVWNGRGHTSTEEELGSHG